IESSGSHLHVPAVRESAAPRWTAGKIATRIGIPLAAIAAAVFAWQALHLRSRIFGPAGPRPIHSIAVLPLENLSADPQQEYFADGMTEALTNDLSKIGALRVISRTSAMLYKNAHKPLPQIARELNVDAVVEGSVERVGDRVKINARLTEASEDRNLWTNSYQRDMSDVLTLQSDVAAAIAAEIRVQLTPRESAGLAKSHPVNPKSYEAYLLGRYLWNKRTPEDLKAAVAEFKKAISLDPASALAWAGLADGYNLLEDQAVMPAREAMPLSEAAARKAISLDDSLAEPHASLASVEWNYDWDLDAAGKEFARAIDLNPNYASAREWHGLYLAQGVGRFDEAIEELERAQQLDPLSPVIEANVGRSYYYAHRYQKAADFLEQFSARHPDFWIAHALLGQTYLVMGRLPDAIRELEKARSLSPESARNLGTLGDAYGRAGRRADALKLAAELAERSKSGYVSPIYSAEIYMGIGDRAQALAFLEKAFGDRSDWMPQLKFEPEFDLMRDDPRFQALLRRVVPRAGASR
ncbi:MAG: TPR end-of-group domain-containing protein, partial [Candidatus Acidiferrales bacterium]